MANKSYLVACDDEAIYPTVTMSETEIENNLLAEDVYCVPLLWLAMFRPADLVSATIVVEEDEDEEEDDPLLADLVADAVGDDDDEDDEDDDSVVDVTAPVAPKERALAQLDAALPALHRLFGDEGRLDEHAALLRQGVAEAPGRFVTIELEEIAVLHSSTEEYYAMVGDALASLDEPTDVAADRERWVDLAQLRPGRPFPPARLVLDGLDAPDDDWWNHSRLLGTRYLRPVPWEPPPDEAPHDALSPL